MRPTVAHTASGPPVTRLRGAHLWLLRRDLTAPRGWSVRLGWGLAIWEAQAG